MDRDEVVEELQSSGPVGSMWGAAWSSGML
jgi:hypothetical protein